MELFDGEDGYAKAADKADIAAIDDLLEKLDEISPNARDNAVHALLFGFSERSFADPPLPAIQRFLHKTLYAAKKAGTASEEARRLAEQARSDRLDPDTEQVQTAAFKVVREFDRLCGILRFNPETAAMNDSESIQKQDRRYTARCAPDHFVLPLLADHFWQRFGKQSWAIIDEKRKLVLFSAKGKRPEMRRLNAKETALDNKAGPEQNKDEWGSLWKHYFRSINNEERANPQLQKQFLPSRYRKYLPELE